MLRRRTLVGRSEGIALLAVCALVLSACGGGDNGTTQAQTETETTAQTQTTGETETETTGQTETETTGHTETETTESTGSANTVSAERYVSSICTSLRSWRRQIEMSGTELGASISGASSAADVRTSYVAYLDDIIAFTDRLTGRVGRAGTPDVERGGQVTADLKSSLRELKSFFVGLRLQVRKLPVADVTALNRRLQAINSSLQPRLAALAKTFESLSTTSGAELQGAVKNTPACAGL